MFVEVNGARFFFDVEGAKLVPDGETMRERPTIVFLHGGPGFDHSAFRPVFSPLAEFAQLVFYDHRGNGRSGRMDVRADLGRIRCPVLLMSGDRDPIAPIAFAQELAAALPPHLVRYERFEGCGHGVHAEDPDRALALIRDFIEAA